MTNVFTEASNTRETSREVVGKTRWYSYMTNSKGAGYACLVQYDGRTGS